jgi:hypothetical protein
LEEILKYHNDYEEKIYDYKNFTVDIHPQYINTRCYFIVKNNGNKEDFSFVKCVENYAAK